MKCQNYSTMQYENYSTTSVHLTPGKPKHLVALMQSSLYAPPPPKLTFFF